MRKADNLPPYCAVVKKSRSLNFLEPSGPAWPVTGVLYLSLITLSNGICHTTFEKDQDGTARKLSTKLYDTYHC